jgi:hypothetical protein
VASDKAGLARPSVEAFMCDDFAAKARCDRSELREQLSDDIVWWPAQRPQERGFGPCPITGADAVVRDITSNAMYGPGVRVACALASSG